MKQLPIVLLLILAGCHTGAPRVKCDAKLTAINAPAPRIMPTAKIPPSGP
jgi:hypothetical protein